MNVSCLCVDPPHSPPKMVVLAHCRGQICGASGTSWLEACSRPSSRGRPVRAQPAPTVSQTRQNIWPSIGQGRPGTTYPPATDPDDLDRKDASQSGRAKLDRTLGIGLHAWAISTRHVGYSLHKSDMSYRQLVNTPLTCNLFRGK